MVDANAPLVRRDPIDYWTRSGIALSLIPARAGRQWRAIP